MCHFPPGTSKWNKIEHRLFSAITQNWRGKPLVSHEVVVNLIGATTSTTGLRVNSELDTNRYPRGRNVSDAELSVIHIRRDVFHGDWNYALLPPPWVTLTMHLLLRGSPLTDMADALPSSVMEDTSAGCGSVHLCEQASPFRSVGRRILSRRRCRPVQVRCARGVVARRFNWIDIKASAAESLARSRATSSLRPAYSAARGLCRPVVAASHTSAQGPAHLELLRDRALMHLLLSSGMTKSEVVSLDRTQIEDASDDSTVILGRGQRERHVFWDAETREALDAWLVARRDDYSPLFIRLDNNRGTPGWHGERWRLSAQSVWKVLLNTDGCSASMPNQAFRHVMASTMLENDAPISLVQVSARPYVCDRHTPGVCGLRSGVVTSGLRPI